MNQVIRRLQNEFKLKWLCPRVIYGRHSNLEEKLLGDLKQKLLWGTKDTDLGRQPCNCPNKYKVNKECAYVGDKSSCRTASTMYKKPCKAQNCNCFYIGKSQHYIKMWVQEHIGEVTKLYHKHILLVNQMQTTTPPLPPLTDINESLVPTLPRDARDHVWKFIPRIICPPKSTCNHNPKWPDNITPQK